MNTDTPETNEALAAILDKDGYLSEDNAPEVLVTLCRTMERERDNARERVDTMFAKLVDTLEQTRNERDEIRAQLREEQQLHVKTLDERDEARETSWFSNGIEYRKRNDYIEARNNLNPDWVVVDSQTIQKP